MLPNTLTLEDVNKVIDLCVQELASTRKIIILEGGYVTTPEYVQSLIEECQHYLYSLAQRQKQKDHKGQARNNKHRLQEPAVRARCDMYLSDLLYTFSLDHKSTRSYQLSVSSSRKNSAFGQKTIERQV